MLVLVAVCRANEHNEAKRCAGFKERASIEFLHGLTTFHCNGRWSSVPPQQEAI